MQHRSARPTESTQHPSGKFLQFMLSNKTTPRSLSLLPLHWPKSGRKAVGEILQEFLNEKNIHWGELLSGVLIVAVAQ